MMPLNEMLEMLSALRRNAEMPVSMGTHVAGN